VAIVTAVTNASSASQWGFRQGDRIVSVNEALTQEGRVWQIERRGRLMQLPIAGKAQP